MKFICKILTISVLLSSLWACSELQPQQQPKEEDNKPIEKTEPTHEADIEIANRVAQYQIDHYPVKDDGVTRVDYHWSNGVLFRGMVTWAQTGNYQACEDFVMGIGTRNKWHVGTRLYHADDICVAQSYLMLYQIHKDETMLAHARDRADYVMANRSNVAVDIRVKNAKDRWCWCDALFMAPPVYALLAQITSDDSYLEFMNEEFRAADQSLFDLDANLYYRDANYFDRKEPNGAKVFWGRGNAWCYAALAILLDLVPKSDPAYNFYKMRYMQMTQSVLATQDKNGSWHASMLDHNSYKSAENSSSGLFTFGLAWGFNRGLLSDASIKKAAQRGWDVLCSYVDADGKLSSVQPIGSSPQTSFTDKSEVYAVGAFLMAASEIIKF